MQNMDELTDHGNECMCRRKVAVLGVQGKAYCLQRPENEHTYPYIDE